MLALPEQEKYMPANFSFLLLCMISSFFGRCIYTLTWAIRDNALSNRYISKVSILEVDRQSTRVSWLLFSQLANFFFITPHGNNMVTTYIFDDAGAIPLRLLQLASIGNRASRAVSKKMNIRKTLLPNLLLQQRQSSRGGEKYNLQLNSC